MGRNVRKEERPMTTIRMVAQACGCSVATVSKALNGAGDVSRETAARIRRTASELGYVPNAAARALKTSRSYCFGIVFRDSNNIGLAHGFFSSLLNGFKSRAEELGYDIFFISDRLGERRIGYAEHARYRNCDGVLIANDDCSADRVQELVRSGIPSVTIDCELEHCGAVQSDNFQGMRDLVQYIHSLGHRRIAFVHGDETLVTRTRVQSFRQTCQELHIDIPKNYIVPARYCETAPCEAATRTLLALDMPPTCIIYPDDLAYIGGRNEIYRQGFRIPEDISCAGYDGIELSQILRPRLTTLRQNGTLMGVSAAVELARAVELGKDYTPRRIVIPGEVLPGESVKILANLPGTAAG